MLALLSLWLVGGVHLDAWAHHQFAVETFFTPWHGVLYAGFFAVAASLVANIIYNIYQGKAWREALPAGYRLSLLGVLLFLLGGLGDMLWHLLFGIEVDVEALLSPTHLLLGVGGALIVSGPARAAWRKGARGQEGWALLPALISLSLLLAVLGFFTAYANPFADAFVARTPPAGGEVRMAYQALGVAGILLHSALTVGVMLAAVRRWALPAGSLTLVVGLAALLAVSVHGDYQLLPAAILAGLFADLLNQVLRPGVERPAAWRLFAFGVPAMLYALYFVTLALTGGLWWTIHLWTGVIVLAGTSGWLLSYAFLPPGRPSS